MELLKGNIFIFLTLLVLRYIPSSFQFVNGVSTFLMMASSSNIALPLFFQASHHLRKWETLSNWTKLWGSTWLWFHPFCFTNPSWAKQSSLWFADCISWLWYWTKGIWSILWWQGKSSSCFSPFYLFRKHSFLHISKSAISCFPLILFHIYFHLTLLFPRSSLYRIIINEKSS